MNLRPFTLINLLMFQSGWFICVLLCDPWAIIYTLAAVVIHFVLSARRADDAVAVMLCLVIGLAHDFFLIAGGYLQFEGSNNGPPLWLTCLWVLMGLTLHHSLKWLYERPFWSGLLGAMSGPLSYLAGVKLSSAQWSGPLTEVLPIIAGLWLLVLPLHRLLSLRIKPYVSH